jgi:diacylglycerol O-acyltransferase / wax synthase
MRQLTSLDVQFLAAEDGRTHGHVSAVSILDPSTAPGRQLTLTEITRVFRERLHLLPPLRWRLVEVPLGLDYPYWIDDPDFDLEFHLRELHLPPPGNLDQLADQVSRIVSRPLDRSRPLWECYLIGGLEHGNVALLIKIHHAVVDGVSGAEILGMLFDTDAGGRQLPPAPPPDGDPTPGTWSLLARGLGGPPRQLTRAATAIPRSIEHLDTLPTLRNIPGVGVASGAVHRLRTRNRDGRLLQRPAGRAPRTRFNTRISPHRRIAFGTLSLPQIKAIKNACGATVNDVIVTLSTAAIRDWLISHHDLPDDPLLAMIPISVRTEAQIGTFGNRVSVMIVPLATNELDPLRRLRLTHERLRAAKERHQAVPADILTNANHLIPPSLFARAAGVTAAFAAAGRLSPPYNVVISNVPGPSVPIYAAGARQIASYPVSVIHDAVGLNVTVFSYQDRVDFGLVADRELIPDLHRITASLQNSLTELSDAAHLPPAGAKRR